MLPAFFWATLVPLEAAQLPIEAADDKCNVRHEARVYSMMDPRKSIDQDSWTISLGRGDGSEHTLLVVEGITDQDERLIRSYDLVAPAVGHQARVRRREYIISDIKVLQEWLATLFEDSSPLVQTWSLDKSKATTLDKCVQGIKTVDYNPAGHKSRFFAVLGGHNSLTWTLEKLKEIGGIYVPSYYKDYWWAYASSYLPKPQKAPRVQGRLSVAPSKKSSREETQKAPLANPIFLQDN